MWQTMRVSDKQNRQGPFPRTLKQQTRKQSEKPPVTAEWGGADNDRSTRKGLSEKMKFKLGVAWQEEASPAKPGGENSRVREQLAPQC